MNRYRHRIAVFLLIALMAVRLFISMRHTALVTDEFVHIPAGYTYLKAQRFDFNPEHPPLLKMLSGLSLMVLNPSLPGDPRHVKDWSQWFKFCSDFFYQPGTNSRQIITWARAPMILVSCLLAWLIFHWGKKAFGIAAGLFALLLYTMEPNVLAFSRILYTDIGASLAYLAFFYCVWRCVKVPSPGNVILAILAASVAPMVKHSMIVVLPVWILVLAGMVLARKIRIRGGLAYIALTLLVFLFVLNMTYGFHSHAFDSRDLKTVAGWVDVDTSQSFINPYLDRCKIIPVPADYLAGMSIVVEHNRMGHPAFLFGQFSQKGWWYYFPLAFAIKTPIPFILLALLGLGWLIGQTFARKGGDAAFLLAPVILYCAVSMSSQINIGIRHLLPIFPFVFISAGGLLQYLWEKRSRLRWFVLALGGWMAIASLAIRYDPLEYFNEFAGGPENGWRYLGESNIDGGQNFIKLAEFLKKTRQQNVYMYLIGVEFMLFSDVDYSLFIPYRLSDGFRKQFPYGYQEEYGSLKPGIYVISVCRMLDPYIMSSEYTQEDKKRMLLLRRFLDLKPEAKIGNVIWIYNLTPEGIERLHLTGMQFFYLNHMRYQPPG